MADEIHTEAGWHVETSYFTDPKATHRIYLRAYDGSDNWVDIAAALATADRKAISAVFFAPRVQINAELQAKLAALKAEGASPDEALTALNELSIGIVGDHEAQYVEMLKRTIKAWSFRLPGPSGQVAPITEQWIRRLGAFTAPGQDRDVGDWLYRQIEAYYTNGPGARPGDDERGNSINGSANGTGAEPISP